MQVAVVVGLGVIFVGGIRFRSRKDCLLNIEKLEWMKDHEMDPPKRVKEHANIETELAKQIYHRDSWISWPITPPRVDWAELPMDNAYLNRFHRNKQ